uniref:NADH-ubiquinone oxidoreductase chain 6 n=1 Tax=Neoperla ignacsiveci TaxID=2021294 RepID=A0A678RWD6_9NEOP|nr:NADH dehydrogenase subunit 6 [Neoperla ignacsiveci]
MSMIVLFLLTSTLALIFTRITHPLAMGLTLLIQTLIICLTTGLLTHSFWFSYILFLVFLGGLLVLFIYVTSLASNEMFTFTPSALSMLFLFIATMILTYLIIDPLSFPLNTNSADSSDTFFFNANEESTPALMKLYNEPTSSITLMLALYLFLTLIAVVKITKIFSGPLRQKN